MSLIVLERASLSFGPQPILTETSLRLSEGDKVGLVGPNGSGKSTLLRILAGQQPLDGGVVNRARGCRVGYLPQDITEVPVGTLLDSVLATVPGRLEVEGRIDEVRREIDDSTDSDEQMVLATRLAELTDQLEHFETYYSEHQALRIIRGLGFVGSDIQRPVAELSGGWRMRAALAGLLFQQPDVLLLDEPTNHLDFPSVLWFDGFLGEYRHAIVLITHDRDFLNRHIARVVSFEPEGVRIYSGDYDDYLNQRASEEEVFEAGARNRDRQVRELERFVERFRAKANKARQAQSRAKQIEKMQQQIERPVPRRRQLKFRFPEVERTGKDVLMIDGVDKAFGPRVLYRGLTRTVYAGDRVAIVGANGAGKTTLLRMMARELEPDDGEIRYGSNVKPGYFAQHHADQLHPRRTVLEEVRQVDPAATESRVRGVCGAFLFSGDDVDKAVGVLSGGERARVLLAKLLMRPGNLLLMDEPTTHLDIASAEALAEALAGYQGTLVLVSHNTAFLNRLATRIWDVVDEGIMEYPGNLAEYREHLERRQRSADEDAAADSAEVRSAPAAAAPAAASETRQERKERKRKEAEQRNARSRLTRDLRRELERVEARISALEAEQGELEPALADPELCADPVRYPRAIARYDDLQRELKKLYRRWEQAQAKIEKVTAELDGAAGH